MTGILHSDSKTELKLEAIYTMQNLSLVSNSHPLKFQPFVDSLVLILGLPHGLDPSNQLLLKEAALNCLVCICVDGNEKLLSNLSFNILPELTRLKRSFLTKSVFEFCISFMGTL